MWAEAFQQFPSRGAWAECGHAELFECVSSTRHHFSFFESKGLDHVSVCVRVPRWVWGVGQRWGAAAHRSDASFCTPVLFKKHRPVLFLLGIDDAWKVQREEETSWNNAPRESPPWKQQRKEWNARGAGGWLRAVSSGWPLLGVRRGPHCPHSSLPHTAPPAAWCPGSRPHCLICQGQLLPVKLQQLQPCTFNFSISCSQRTRSACAVLRQKGDALFQKILLTAFSLLSVVFSARTFILYCVK